MGGHRITTRDDDFRIDSGVVRFLRVCCYQGSEEEQVRSLEANCTTWDIHHIAIPSYRQRDCDHYYRPSNIANLYQIGD